MSKFRSCCRLCLNYCSNKINCLEIDRLKTAIKIFFGFELKKGDNRSVHICLNCHQKLSEMNLYRKFVRENQEILDRLVEKEACSLPIKIEDDDYTVESYLTNNSNTTSSSCLDGFGNTSDTTGRHIGNINNPQRSMLENTVAYARRINENAVISDKPVKIRNPNFITQCGTNVDKFSKQASVHTIPSNLQTPVQQYYIPNKVLTQMLSTDSGRSGGNATISDVQITGYSVSPPKRVRNNHPFPDKQSEAISCIGGQQFGSYVSNFSNQTLANINNVKQVGNITDKQFVRNTTSVKKLPLMNTTNGQILVNAANINKPQVTSSCISDKQSTTAGTPFFGQIMTRIPGYSMNMVRNTSIPGKQVSISNPVSISPTPIIPNIKKNCSSSQNQMSVNTPNSDKQPAINSQTRMNISPLDKQAVASVFTSNEEMSENITNSNKNTIKNNFLKQIIPNTDKLITPHTQNIIISDVQSLSNKQFATNAVNSNQSATEDIAALVNVQNAESTNISDKQVINKSSNSLKNLDYVLKKSSHRKSKTKLPTYSQLKKKVKVILEPLDLNQMNKIKNNNKVQIENLNKEQYNLIVQNSAQSKFPPIKLKIKKTIGNNEVPEFSVAENPKKDKKYSKNDESAYKSIIPANQSKTNTKSVKAPIAKANLGTQAVNFETAVTSTPIIKEYIDNSNNCPNLRSSSKLNNSNIKVFSVNELNEQTKKSAAEQSSKLPIRVTMKKLDQYMQIKFADKNDKEIHFSELNKSEKEAVQNSLLQPKSIVCIRNALSNALPSEYSLKLLNFIGLKSIFYNDKNDIRTDLL